MIHSKLYRINEYRISEFADGRLWWDAHSGLGKQIGGPCFVYGNMLIFGTRCSEEDGFLKLEFFNQLKRLPFWHKTRYYCFISALMDVSSGTNISEQKLQQLIALAGRTDTDSENMVAESPGTFRFWQYQISIAPNGEIIWKTCGGMGQVFGGSAIIESDVLFLGPKKFDDPRQKIKETFFTAIRIIPKVGPNKSLVSQFGFEIDIAGREKKSDFFTSKKREVSTTNENCSQESSFKVRQTSMVATYRLLFKYGR